MSLFPAREIVRQVHQKNRAAWQLLGALIILFLAGYVVYGGYLLRHPAAVHDVIAATIMLGGGIFVAGVVAATRRSIVLVRELAEKERFRALHDELTGLPNRMLLQDRLDHAILMAKRMREPMAVVFMDLDRFKEINDTLGHHYGDYLLQEVAARFRGAVRATDTLARLGGDEFAVILPGVDTVQAAKVAMKLAAALDRPFSVEGHSLSVGVSAGIAVYPEHGDDSELLMQRADVAMYVAKRNDIVYALYHPDEDQSSVNRLILVGQLREAIAGSGLLLHYQPKISLRDGSLCGVEALIRWQHQSRGLIPPDEFIPIAEQAGLIRPLSHWVIDHALAQNASWRRHGYRMPVSVNLSVKNLQDTNFPDVLFDLLNRWNASPDDLVLEITESTMMTDPARVQHVLDRLVRAGLKLSIDDYGTGYSSLAYLRRFPALEIKIDKSFVLDMITNEDNAVIVRSTIDMIHTIGRQVVAEGVEDDATLARLEELGCDCLQGYHICRPLPAEEIEKWLATTSWQVKRLSSPHSCDRK
ncbi:MAG: EAL domain-containing protein [Thermodesulfobacteriota bacterium]